MLSRLNGCWRVARSVLVLAMVVLGSRAAAQSPAPLFTAANTFTTSSHYVSAWVANWFPNDAQEARPLAAAGRAFVLG